MQLDPSANLPLLPSNTLTYNNGPNIHFLSDNGHEGRGVVQSEPIPQNSPSARSETNKQSKGVRLQGESAMERKPSPQHKQTNKSGNTAHITNKQTVYRCKASRGFSNGAKTQPTTQTNKQERKPSPQHKQTNKSGNPAHNTNKHCLFVFWSGVP